MSKNKYAEILKTYFADCYKDGRFDIDAFARLLESGGTEIKQNGYGLNFSGREYALRSASAPPSSTAVPLSGEENKRTENEYIVGDNLEALKLLKPTRCGKIDCIYIDPPYNTGGDGLIFNDRFGSEQQNGQGALSLAGRHTRSAYLAFMYPRLMLARELLSDDGVIFISIDDNECADLRLVCNEIFGENNYITTFIWEKTQHYGRQKLNCYVNADYIICYAKNKKSQTVKELLVESVTADLTDAPLFNASNGIAEITFPPKSVKFKIPDGTYCKTESGDYELATPVTVINGINANEFTLKFRSRWSSATVRQQAERGTSYLIKTRTFAVRAVYSADKVSTVAPKQIIFTNQSNPHRTVSRYGERVDTSENATKHLAELMGGAAFSYPKPVTLIKYLLSLLYDCRARAHANGFTVLDFFSGSGTTAQAVMELNVADGGNRKFIMVQMPENLDGITSCTGTAKTVLLNAVKICDECGLRHDIAELGRERIRRAAAKLRELHPMLSLAADLDFKTYYLK